MDVETLPSPKLLYGMNRRGVHRSRLLLELLLCSLLFMEPPR
jgi:hypothetical protein